eukprot:TRINITY_DN10199_c0_g1_i1.p1 TRINITY_DN10199_c0_g1~~TRINITY_DN10199_c0_g1_i1.p1  ORF type:complete len:592 (+),score=117.76 TRINITY_DN10199_c0_g1_i1:25-1776(+)
MKVKRSHTCVLGGLAFFFVMLLYSGDDANQRKAIDIENTLIKRLEEEERLLSDDEAKNIDETQQANPVGNKEANPAGDKEDEQYTRLQTAYNKPNVWRKNRDQERPRHTITRPQSFAAPVRPPPPVAPLLPPPSSSENYDERFLLLPAVQVGFASGIRTAILPFLMLAAKTGRTAVLPPMQFGIPAFRSTSDPQFLELADFLDMKDLLSHLPCVKTVSYADWKTRTSATIDALLQFGLPEELGTGTVRGKAIPDPAKQAFMENCIPVDVASSRPKQPRKPGPFWAGTFGHAQEVMWLHSTEGLIINRRVCVSFQTTLSAVRTFAHVEEDKSVMIYNVPGMVRGPFVAGGGNIQGVLKMFRDVPETELCKTPENTDMVYPGFRAWPQLAVPWVEMGKKFKEDVFKGEFTCVQIRGEKMVLRAAATGNTGSVSSLRANDPYLTKCVDGMIDIINAKKTGKLLLVTDLDVSTGSPSARRSGSLSQWSTTTLKKLKQSFPGSEIFCSEQHMSRLKSTSSDDTLSRVLKAYDGNCAIGETAVCRQSSSILRFGTGSMGDFVVGSTHDNEEAQWYKTCDDVIKGAPVTR